MAFRPITPAPLHAAELILHENSPSCSHLLGASTSCSSWPGLLICFRARGLDHKRALVR
ncbi:hypothetical protein C8Q73DRAFT_839106 [Cubamyces lactineus]|nr:hypothetical protein C8Q73DRAFT_839106 [Cubamyces lactineus]